ncbi:iron chelate uptake ABC transporter family permease subunit [Roseobacter sp. HKCCD9010]|uniref:FecCD family ABC transporter permease n=1 Tax=unclassified Roseobacter TaxID=196798 RepID=UPI001492ECD0|nr:MULTISPECIES: iron ABC transporter permease [unclassified Roseobacter]MBF9051750.1 iron chelate uptake ABC transporter family permease subunit [Rhodobacterales bacterium HKCCD4356]NNV13743.1 iron chelate uptake ABC transporter family permease subunit [Roseobacter sp. HKCCD7357]NNV17768.1 iron chelate uptake ABC transporter family permease subunit [Roseobacter sp. HKCCD8768]NNV27375.1 iron chelate uptake ABC transporter family permease subunit [Roseobacter sp. HKCCD8192]NNV31495.1 iron chela
MTIADPIAHNVSGPTFGDRQGRAQVAMICLTGLLIIMSVASLSVGASGASLWNGLWLLIRGEAINARDAIILFDIRLPRLALGILVGAALAVSGAVMQGLFRNPLADPGLVGVGAGAGLGAITAIVLGGMLPLMLRDVLSYYLVPLAAFLGGWLTTILLYRISTSRGRTSVAVMLLGGIAMGALAGAISGVLIYMADDAQLRDLTFWGLGSLAGATWDKVLIAGPLILMALATTPFLARSLNGLALGEAPAAHLGIPVQRMKNISILTVAAATGAAVAVSGGIGFVGIVVPHLLRIMIGPDHRYLLPNAALLGATLLIAADMISRAIIAPAELPIGIVTATLGGPFFLWILLRNRSLLDL